MTTRRAPALTLVLGLLAAQALAADPPEMLIRVDDVGMNHAVNSAVRKLVHTGVPFSASVMVPCPWFTEAAAILRDSPQVSVGIHLTLNSEWSDYKWGPLLGRGAVSSLVDPETGYFFTTGEQLRANEPDLDEVEAELRAQIQRAIDAGLDIDYLDYHMLTAVSTPGLRSVVEKLADEFGVGLSRYFGEPSVSLWDVEPDLKLTTLLDAVRRSGPEKPLLVVMHLGLDNDEMNALVDDNNPADPYRVAQHRAAELEALTSPAFLRMADARGIRFVTYGDLARRHGLESLRAPAEFGYTLGTVPADR